MKYKAIAEGRDGKDIEIKLSPISTSLRLVIDDVLMYAFQKHKYWGISIYTNGKFTGMVYAKTSVTTSKSIKTVYQWMDAEGNSKSLNTFVETLR